jgi:hypothetical protein
MNNGNFKDAKETPIFPLQIIQAAVIRGFFYPWFRLYAVIKLFLSKNQLFNLNITLVFLFAVL